MAGKALRWRRFTDNWNLRSIAIGWPRNVFLIVDTAWRLRDPSVSALGYSVAIYYRAYLTENSLDLMTMIVHILK